MPWPTYCCAAGVPQPLVIVKGGPVGTPDDAANRKVDIVPSTTFEATYASNRYSVGEHEFGHAIGLPDEYQNITTGPLGASRRRSAIWRPLQAWRHPTSGATRRPA